MKPLPPALAVVFLCAGCLPGSAARFDQDGDGAVALERGGGDCDDADPSIHPTAAENCDGQDNDCDGQIDEGFSDIDGDGVPDCRDPETCDGQDNDGDGREDEGFSDVDGNGVADCVDLERCDGVDNNQDGQIDEGFDEDGRGGADCRDDDGDGLNEDRGDCDDEDPAVDPGSPYDWRDGIDNDCDKLADEPGGVGRAPGYFQGEQAGDQAGFVVVNAGDVDGDGQDDLLISARQASRETASEVGRVYLVAGGSLPEGRHYLEADAAAVWEGVSVNEEAGTTLAAAGDINGDGFDDVLVGSPDASFGGLSACGVVYLIPGTPGGYPTGVTLEEVAIARFIGRASGDGLGTAITGLGDFNGDGYADFALSAPGVNVTKDSTTTLDLGEVYVLTGRPGGFTGDLLISSAPLTFRGLFSTGGFGRSLAGPGDVDGDGFDDLLVGDPNADPGGMGNAGSAWLLRGGTLTGLYPLDGGQGVPFLTFTGIAAGDGAGAAVAGPGDLDGDGFPELMVASPTSTVTGGQLYLFYGEEGLEGGERVLSAADVCLGQSNAGLLGHGMATGGDVDGDGLPDVLVHAPGPTVPVGNIPVYYYLMRGESGLEPSIKLELSAAVVFQSSYPAAPGALELLRYSSALIDLDGDGHAELLIAVPRASDNSINDPGTVYVFPGY